MNNGIFSSFDNIFGGHDLFDKHGNYHGHAENNISGGHDLSDKHGNYLGHAENNISGGHDLFDKHGNYFGHTETDLIGNGTSILNFADPLAHINSYKMPTFNLNG